MMSNRSGSNQTGAVNACVRWKEASTALHPRKATALGCVLPATPNENVAPISTQETPGSERCPASIDVYTAYESVYAHYLLTANLVVNVNGNCRATTAIGGGQNCLINFSNSVPAASAADGAITITTENATFPNGVNATVADANSVRIIPNVNRMEAARQAASRVYSDNSSIMRIGFARFNGSNGADILNQGAEIGSANMASKINLTRAEDSTPLQEAYYEVLRYFAGLTPDFGNSAAVNGTSAYRSPIQYRCQKNNIVVLTDGEPTNDIYNGSATGCTPASLPPRRGDLTSLGTSTLPDNLNYDGVADACITSSLGSNYKYQPLMDDLAQWAYESDLRTTTSTTSSCYGGETLPPAGRDCTGTDWNVGKFAKQNINTYTVGFGLQNDMLVETPEAKGTLPVSIVNTTDNTLTFSTNHELNTGNKVLYRRASINNTVSIGGLTHNTNYYAVVMNATTIKLATTEANANNKNAIGDPAPITVDITSNGGVASNHVISKGPGKFFLSMTANELSADLASAFSEINQIVSSASAVATNSTRLDSNTRVYQARFDTADWSGDLQAYDIGDNDGVVTTTSPIWQTSRTITSATRGTMLTSTIANNGTSTGVAFNYANLSATQQADINGDANVISWISGNEITGYRPRTKGLVGDIINSDPIFVGPLNYGYMKMSDPCTSLDGITYDSGNNCTGAKLYEHFVEQSKTRTGTIFFGANDGQLRGVNAINGTERVSYIPAGVYSDWADTDEDGFWDAGETQYKKLYDLTREPYDHKYFVDGSPNVGDAWDGTRWRTLLAGTLGAGGRSVFVLDVTDDTFTTSDVLWEYANDGRRGATDERRELGYSFSRPVIGRLQNGDWAVIVGNGYDSAGDKAQLFILNAFTGALIKKIDTGVGTAAVENGLSSVQVEVDSNRTVIRAYAGDLRGNIWRFDLSDTSPNNWGVSRLFTATDDNNNRQPITGGIRLGSNPDAEGTMVFFGTGKYFESSDNIFNSTTTPRFHTFYGILDDGSGTAVAKTSLVSQSLSTLGSFRSVSDNEVDYQGTDRGWYVNLVVGTDYEGERVVTSPVLYGGRIIFVSLISKNEDRCVGGGKSWLYDLDALNGGLINETPVFDQNNDGVIDSEDQPTAGHDDPSGGILSEPTIITAGGVDYKLMGSTSSSNSVVSIKEAPPLQGDAPVIRGRMSWRQLQ